MGNKLGTNFRVCQTCQYWDGLRKINGFEKQVESISEKGKCVNTKGFYNQNMSRMGSCPHHSPVV